MSSVATALSCPAFSRCARTASGCAAKSARLPTTSFFSRERPSKRAICGYSAARSSVTSTSVSLFSILCSSTRSASSGE